MSVTVTDKNAYKVQHVRAIKERLETARLAYNTKNSVVLTNYQLAKLLEEGPLGDGAPTAAALGKIFKYDNDATDINISVVVELCRIFDVNVGSILAPPGDTYDGGPNLAGFGPEYTSLTDPFYLGNYSCYMLRTSYAAESNNYKVKTDTLRDNDEILCGDLNMEYKNGHSTATLILHHKRIDFDSKEVIMDSILKGTIHKSTTTDNIHINLISRHGVPYTIQFSYEQFFKAPMYYREGLLVTSSPGKERLPHCSKILFFKNPVQEKDYKYLLGLLSINVKNLVISQKKLNTLAKNNPLIKQFLKEFDAHLKLYKREAYLIPESIITSNSDTTMPFADLKKVMLLLRNHSYSLAQFEIGNDSKASVIAREIQNYTLPDDTIEQ